MYVWKKDDLNHDQEAAILQDDNVFVIACPGSGKTRTLAYKVAYELSKNKSNKKYVIAITYTNRAADEICERIERLGVDVSQLWVGTIHSFCLEWILRPYSIYDEHLKHGFRVINSHESETIFTELCAPYNYPRITIWDCGYFFENDGYVLSCNDNRKHKSLHEIMPQYFTVLENNKQIDYELILHYAHKILTRIPSVSKTLSKLFSFILIDEYQDTKKIQYYIIGLILNAGKGSTKTFIVGDPNQAIFQTLGGYAIEPNDFMRIANIELVELSLTLNYRSSSIIIDYFSNYDIYGATIEPASEEQNYSSIITFNNTIHRDELEDELVKLIRFNINEKDISPNEICILAPWWVQLASMTRRLVARLPEYSFDGPGMVPFARDVENFWYRISKIVLTEPSPRMYVRRIRWAKDILSELEHAGANTSDLTPKKFLKECNSITITETNGLNYLREYFSRIFYNINVDYSKFPMLQEHYESFFNSSQIRIDRLVNEGSGFIADIESFRRVFKPREGITISSMHGVKGTEFDTVIAFAVLEGMVPHFNDLNGQDNAMKMLYVIASRARKNLHLLSERGRLNGLGCEYTATTQLINYEYQYNNLTPHIEGVGDK